MAGFGKYQVVEQIGQGGFGKVFKGYDAALKRDVAIKTCSFQSQELRERFVREAEISANLRHPNIVTVYDFGEEGGEPYLVQEYLPGEDLDQKIRRGEAMTLSARLDYLIQIGEGLRFAHDHGVVHRDVKPANMRVQPDGQVRIMDFGIAKLVEAERQLTQVGTSVGTTGYLAPEQLRGETIDQRADIFSFGVMAYELVAYRKPFDGDSVSTIFYRIAHEPPPPLPDLAPDCPPRLAACITRCLEKDPARRYHDFTGVLADLRAVQAELAASGAGAGTPGTIAVTTPMPASGSGAHGTGAERPRRRWLRSPALWGLGLATLIVAILGVLNLSQLAESQSPTGRPAGPAAGASGSGAAVGADTIGAGAAAGRRVGAAGTGGSGTGGSGTPSDAGSGGSTPAVQGATAAGQAAASGGSASRVPQPASPPAAAQAAAARSTASGAAHEGGAASSPATDLSRARILVLVRGDVEAASQAADAALTSALGDAGRDVVDAGNMGDVQAPAGIRATPGQLGDMRRATGAGIIVLATLQTSAVASVGAFYTGTATLVTHAYDARTGRLLHAETFQVGGDTPGKLGSSPVSARSEAAAQAARMAAVKILRIGAMP